MSGYYSFVVWVPDEVNLKEHLLILDPGVNVFNLTLSDVEAFKKKLLELGVVIKQVHNLSESGPDPRLLGS